MTRIITIAVMAALGLSAAACQTLKEARPAAIRNTGYGDRCADYMRLSYPGVQIAVTITRVAAGTPESGRLGTLIMDVEGTRPDVQAGGFLARDVAARCRFENGILTQFRWTKGPYK